MQNIFQKTLLISSIIFLVLSCVIFVFLYKEIKKKDQAAVQALFVWQNEAMKRNGMKLLDSSIRAMSAERAKLDTHFAKSSDVVPFLDLIEAMAPKVGAEAQVSLLKIADDRHSLLVEVDASGSFSSIYKFLTLLENSPYELDIVSADINKASLLGSGDPKSKSLNWVAVFRIKLLSFEQ